MIKALLLIFEPMVTWERIAHSRRSVGFILGVYLLPLLVLTSVVEGLGLMHFGKFQIDLARMKVFSMSEAVLFEVAQLLLTLVVVFISAKVIRSLGETFHSRHNFNQAFTVVAYGLSPVFLFRMLDAFSMASYVPWLIGIILTIAILYHGVPRVMEPDPSHAFGLYFASSLLLCMTTGMLTVASFLYLSGKLPGLENLTRG